MTDSILNAYTVGDKKSYDKLLADEKTPKKLGRQMIDGTLYEGGWVWRTRREAEDFLLGVDPVWDPRYGHKRMGDGMISFDGRRPILCAVYGLVLPNGWDGDVSVRRYSDGVHRLLTDSLIVRV